MTMTDADRFRIRRGERGHQDSNRQCMSMVDGGIGKEGTSGVEDGIDGEGGGEVALSSKLQ